MTEQALDYRDLSPELMLDAIESVGIRVDSGLLELNSYENRVFQFQDEDRQRMVVKFYRPGRWQDVQILEEHDFTLQLRDADIDVVAPLQFSGESLCHFRGHRFAIFPSVGGRPIEVDDLSALERLGRTLGRVHQIAAKQAFQHRPMLSTRDFVDAPRQILQASQFVPYHLEDAFYNAYDQLALCIQDQYQPTAANLIRLHGDLHAGNILCRDNIMLLDFDDCRQGPAIQDLWMMLHGERHEQALQLEVMLENYEEFYSFDTRQLALIEPLRGMRMMNYMGWIAKRWDDPAFQRHFGWFTDTQYWQQQIIALQEQVDNIQRPPLSLVPNY